MSGTVCCYSGCKKSYSTDKDVSFFKFPDDPKRRKKWMQNCGNLELENLSDRQLRGKRICSDHFRQNSFVRPESRTVLSDGAVPIPTKGEPKGDNKKTPVAASPAPSQSPEKKGREANSVAAKTSTPKTPAQPVKPAQTPNTKAADTPGRSRRSKTSSNSTDNTATTSTKKEPTPEPSSTKKLTSESMLEAVTAVKTPVSSNKSKAGPSLKLVQDKTPTPAPAPSSPVSGKKGKETTVVAVKSAASKTPTQTVSKPNNKATDGTGRSRRRKLSATEVTDSATVKEPTPETSPAKTLTVESMLKAVSSVKTPVAIIKQKSASSIEIVREKSPTTPVTAPSPVIAKKSKEPSSAVSKPAASTAGKTPKVSTPASKTSDGPARSKRSKVSSSSTEVTTSTTEKEPKSAPEPSVAKKLTVESMLEAVSSVKIPLPSSKPKPTPTPSLQVVQDKAPAPATLPSPTPGKKGKEASSATVKPVATKTSTPAVPKPNSKALDKSGRSRKRKMSPAATEVTAPATEKEPTSEPSPAKKLTVESMLQAVSSVKLPVPLNKAKPPPAPAVEIVREKPTFGSNTVVVVRPGEGDDNDSDAESYDEYMYYDREFDFEHEDDIRADREFERFHASLKSFLRLPGKWSIGGVQWDPQGKRKVILISEPEIPPNGRPCVKRCLQCFEDKSIRVFIDQMDMTDVFGMSCYAEKEDVAGLITRVAESSSCCGVPEMVVDDLVHFPNVRKRNTSFFDPQCPGVIPNDAYDPICSACKDLQVLLMESRAKEKRRLLERRLRSEEKHFQHPFGEAVYTFFNDIADETDPSKPRKRRSKETFFRKFLHDTRYKVNGDSARTERVYIEKPISVDSVSQSFQDIVSKLGFNMPNAKKKASGGLLPRPSPSTSTPRPSNRLFSGGVGGMMKRHSMPVEHILPFTPGSSFTLDDGQEYELIGEVEPTPEFVEMKPTPSAQQQQQFEIIEVDDETLARLTSSKNQVVMLPDASGSLVPSGLPVTTRIDANDPNLSQILKAINTSHGFKVS